MQWICFFFCCCCSVCMSSAAVSETRCVWCALPVPFTSTCMFVSLSFCCVSFGHSSASLLTLHNLCASPTSEDYDRLTLSVCARFSRLCSLPLCLSVNWRSLPSSDVLSLSSHCCLSNMCFLVVIICLLCLCSRTHLFLSDMLAHLKPFCAFLHDIYVFCLFCMVAADKTSHRLESKYHGFTRCLVAKALISCGILQAWWMTFIDLHWKQRISCSTDSWWSS